MADDGLLINFDVPTGPIFSKTVLRGGPWRERRRVELKQKNRTQKPDPGPQDSHPVKGSVDDKEDVSPPVKRQKLESSQPRAIQNAVHDLRNSQSSNYGRQVISSLFTSNPSAKTVFDPGPEASTDAPVEPSNAPLTSEQLNFINLGLSARIATHLTNKLSITAPTAIQKAAIPLLLKDDSDAFIQSQTGSGKTLAYVLPIIDRIVRLSTSDGKPVHRDSGLFAIILAPTRELCKQISVVLESALRFISTIVAGGVMGGEKKKSEKARLRKGLNILVATPGRLADHFSHTEVLDVSSVRWLVLDEGDRLMELGFEDDIKRILSRLDFRLKNPKGSVLESLPKKRINVLCSATLRGDVQKLGDISLKEAQHISADVSKEILNLEDAPGVEKKFTVPAQLKQTYLIVAAKLRLVTLHSLLEKGFKRCPETMKMIVFLSCADSVNFHFQVLTRIGEDSIVGELQETVRHEGQELEMGKSSKLASKARQLIKRNQIPKNDNQDDITSGAATSISTAQAVTVFRLHGSLVQAKRTSTLTAFSKCKTPALLLCTDIASRGLDLPHVDRIIEYDAAFSREEHLHRVGRTARAGKEGQASVFLMPGCEEGYVEVLKSERDKGEIGMNVRGMSAEQLLQSAFDDSTKSPSTNTALNKKRKAHMEDNLKPWEQHATDFQLDIERWVLNNPAILESARRAYQSHIRAYATHVKEERQWFDIKQLHLGHLAKAFGLRDRPGNVNVPGMRASAGKVKVDRRKAGARAHSTNPSNKEPGDVNELVDLNESRNKMRKIGMMKDNVNEFNIA